MPVYQMFRETLWDYMLEHGIVTPEDFIEVDDDFRRQQDLYVHLEQTAAEDWVAEDAQENLVGWARSVERDGHLQLTHFFVATSTQGNGVGRALLDRAFPLDRGEQRSVIATTNSRALSLYLRYGVNVQGMAFSFYGTPKQREFHSDLTVEQAPASPATLQQLVDIDSAVLGYQRPTDLEFFMNSQPTYLLHRSGSAVGYAFGCNGKSAGPAATLEADDLPAALHRIEQSACQIELDSLWVTVPASAQTAVNWALTSGYHIDPFHEVLLAKNPSMNLDRYIMTQSAFIW